MSDRRLYRREKSRRVLENLSMDVARIVTDHSSVVANRRIFAIPSASFCIETNSLKSRCNERLVGLYHVLHRVSLKQNSFRIVEYIQDLVRKLQRFSVTVRLARGQYKSSRNFRISCKPYQNGVSLRLLE